MISPLRPLSTSELPPKSPFFFGFKDLFSKAATMPQGNHRFLRNSIMLVLEPLPTDIKIALIRKILLEEEASFAHDFLIHLPPEALSKEEYLPLVTDALNRPELLKDLLTQMPIDDSDKDHFLQLLVEAAKNNQVEAIKVLVPEHLSLDDCLSAIERSTDSEELSLLLKSYQLFFDPECFQRTVLFPLLIDSSNFNRLDHLKVFIGFIDDGFSSLFTPLPRLIDLRNLDALELLLKFLPATLKTQFLTELLSLLPFRAFGNVDLIQFIQRTLPEEEIVSALINLSTFYLDLVAPFLIAFSSDHRVNFVAEIFSKSNLRSFTGPSGLFFSDLFNLLSFKECREVLSRFPFSQETVHSFLHSLLYFQNRKLIRAFLLILPPLERSKILTKSYTHQKFTTPLTIAISLGSKDLITVLMEGLTPQEVKRVVNQRIGTWGLTSLDFWALHPFDGIQSLLQSMGAVFSGTDEKRFTKIQNIRTQLNRLRPLSGSYLIMFPYLNLPRLFSSASKGTPLYAKAIEALSKAPDNILVSLDTLADRILAGETVVMPTGWLFHQTSLIFSGSLVIRCNRGAGSEWHDSSILVYDMQIKPEREKLIGILKKIRENRLKHPFFGQFVFYKHLDLVLGLTPRFLTKSEFLFLKQKPQKTPNCVNASAKSALRALIYLTNLSKKDHASEESLIQGKALYKKITKADRDQARALLALQRS